MKLKQLFLSLALGLASAVAIAAPVNINTADQKELESLNGIGPKLAAAILQDRKEKGPYKSVDDLTRVHGVSKKVVDKNRAGMTVTQ